MNYLKFCMKCANESLVFDGEKKFSCSNCDFVLYHNCAAAVAVLIKCGEEYMFTKRNQNPSIGKLDLAGGFTDPKESAEQTCARELKEELNVEINPEKLSYLMSLPNVYHYKEMNYNTLDLFFLYEIEQKLDVQLEIAEISEVVWVRKDDIPLENIAFDSQKKFFEIYLQKDF